MRLPRINITLKFLGYLMLLSVIPLIAVGFVSYTISSNLLQSAANRFAVQLVESQKDYLDLQLQQVEELMINLAGVEEIRTTLARTDLANNTFTRLSTLAQIGNILNRYITAVPELVSINIFANNGLNFYVGDTLNTEDIRDDVRQQVFDIAVSRKDNTVSWTGIEQNVNENSNHPYVLTAAEVIYRFNRETLTQEPIAMFLISYGIEGFYQRFSNVDLGAGSYFMIIDGQGRLVYHPEMSRIGQPAPSEILAILENNTQSNLNVRLNGAETSINYSRSAVTDWLIIGFVPIDTLTADADVIRTTTAAITLVSFVVVAITAYLYSRNTVNPIRQITQSFQRLQSEKPQLHLQLAVKSNDEIGDLVRWFNSFLENLITKQKAEQALMQRIEFEKVVTQISTEFINVSAQEVNKTIENALQQIGTINELAFAFVCVLPQASNEQGLISHLWKADSQREYPRFVPAPLIQNWFARLQAGKALKLADVRLLQAQYPAEYEFIQAFDVQAFVIVPLRTQAELIGFVAFASSTARQWEAENVGLLALVGQIVGTALERQRVEAEREQLVDELRTANALAQESSRLKSEFLATMSHELRTPLNAIQGFTSILLEGLIIEIPQQANDLLERVQSNSERLLALINDILDISRIEAGGFTLSPIMTEPRKLIKKWQDEVSILAERKGIAFHVSIAPSLPQELYIDSYALSKIALNLLSNAFKFTHQGAVTLSIEHDDNIWMIQVSDTGIGIPEHAQKYIFEEFRQADQSSTREYGGTGLGLSIVQKLAEAMGGQINLVSQVGSGSRFTVTLPLQTKPKEGDV